VKKISLAIALSVSLCAGQYTKQDRIKDMQDMAEAMSNIETGFFYNNKDIVNNGALKLSDTIRKIQPPLEEKEEEDPLTRYMNKKVQFTNRLVSKIDSKAKIIIERFSEGDVQAATQAYTKIMEKCMQCHYEIREW
jgi:hypothetical protein